MGTWGEAPWDNDEAADFFVKELRDTGFVADVVATLEDNEAAEDGHRGAAAAVVSLGRGYVWPEPDHLEYHLELAAASLQRIRDKGSAAYAPEQLEEEIDILKRRAAHGGSAEGRNPQRWDNAGTAAYIRSLLERTGLAFAARQAMSSPWGEEEFRAAAALVVLFGREDAWPSELERDLRTARDGLREMLAHDSGRTGHWLREEPREAWRNQIAEEIEILDARIEGRVGSDTRSPSLWETETEEAVRSRGLSPEYREES